MIAVEGDGIHGMRQGGGLRRWLAGDAAPAADGVGRHVTGVGWPANGNGLVADMERLTQPN